MITKSKVDENQQNWTAGKRGLISSRTVFSYLKSEILKIRMGRKLFYNPSLLASPAPLHMSEIVTWNETVMRWHSKGLEADGTKHFQPTT